MSRGGGLTFRRCLLYVYLLAPTQGSEIEIRVFGLRSTYTVSPLSDTWGRDSILQVFKCTLLYRTVKKHIGTINFSFLLKFFFLPYFGMCVT